MQRGLWSWLEKEWVLVLPVSFCFALILAFFEMVLFAFLVLASDSPLGHAVLRVNPALCLLGREGAVALILGSAWPCSFVVVAHSRWAS